MKGVAENGLVLVGGARERERTGQLPTRGLRDHQRPRTPGDCPPSPCPFVGCRHHLANEVLPARARKVKGSFATYARPADAPDQVHIVPEWMELAEQLGRPTCALEVTARFPQGLTSRAVGNILGLSHERVLQIEKAAFDKLRAAGVDMEGWG